MSCSADPEAEDGLAYFAPTLGGLLCEECRAVSKESFPVPPGSPQRLRGLLNRPLKEIEPDPGYEESLVRVVRAHIEAHAPAANPPDARGPVRRSRARSA